MTEVELTVPERLDMQIAQLVDQGEFEDEEQAIQELLSTGIQAYRTGGSRDEDFDAEYEEEDMMREHEDEYVF